jgi:hypothetical protein
MQKKIKILEFTAELARCVIYNEIKMLKSNMNTNRQIFLWAHLNKFY